MNAVEPYRTYRGLDPKAKARLKRGVRAWSQGLASSGRAAAISGTISGTISGAAGRADRPGRRIRLHLWLPLSLLWVLLAPLVILALPILAIPAAPRRINPVAVAWGLGAVLFALSGTLVDIEAPGASVKLRLL